MKAHYKGVGEPGRSVQKSQADKKSVNEFKRGNKNYFQNIGSLALRKKFLGSDVRIIIHVAQKFFYSRVGIVI